MCLPPSDSPLVMSRGRALTSHDKSLITSHDVPLLTSHDRPLLTLRDKPLLTLHDHSSAVWDNSNEEKRLHKYKKKDWSTDQCNGKGSSSSYWRKLRRRMENKDSLKRLEEAKYQNAQT